MPNTAFSSGSMVTAHSHPRRTASSVRLKEAAQGIAFISPWIIGYLLFTLGPLLTSLYYSFHQYGLLGVPRWIGLENYATAFTGDRLFWRSVTRTLYWSVTSVPLGIVGSFLAALLLNRGVKGTTAWRVCFFLPSLTPQVAAVVLWMWILQPDVGILNNLVRLIFGVRGPGWLTHPSWAMPSLILISLWTGVGGSRMLIFLAGLQGVPRELYDAALVDGANSWQKARHVTIPLVSPTIFFNLILGLISSLQVFGIAFIATAGGPAYATYFYALHLYQTAFKSFDMGYGSALAWILFLCIVVMTLIQISLSERWVHYTGDIRR